MKSFQKREIKDSLVLQFRTILKARLTNFEGNFGNIKKQRIYSIYRFQDCQN